MLIWFCLYLLDSYLRVFLFLAFKSNSLVKYGDGENSMRGTITMALTRAFRETVIKRAAGDDDYRRGLLAEAVNEILDGNLEAGRAMLRDYINATITFPELARRLNKSSKSIHRMLGSGGNPRMDSLIGVLRILQEHERVRLQTTCLTATA